MVIDATVDMLLKFTEVVSFHSGAKSSHCILIHDADPQSRPVVITIFTLVSVCPHFLKSHKTKQLSSEKSDHFCRDYGFGRGDHWWHTCLVSILFHQPFYALCFDGLSSRHQKRKGNWCFCSFYLLRNWINVALSIWFCFRTWSF